MLVDRMMRAAQLDSKVFAELEKDTTATTDALYVVLMVAAAGGISGALRSLFSGHPGAAISGLIFGLIWGVIAWVVWSLVTYWVGTSLFQGTATPGELMRCIGFAYAPNVLQVVGFIPVLGGLVVFVASIWSLVAGVVAVREALDVDTTKAILTVVIGWVAMVVIGIVLSIFGLGGMAVMSMF